MKMSLRSLLAASLALSLSLSAPLVHAQESESARDWQLFGHFVNVAQPDKALPYAEKLLALDDASFLAAIEANRTYQPDDLAPWVTSNEVLKDTWAQIEDKYQQALTERSRSEEQILADIEALGGTARQMYLAIERLKTTGQFAAPYYIRTLQDETKSRLHSRVINAMVEVGSELTYPLATSLPHVDPTTQVYLARVLGDIGHPEALPFLKVVAESDAGANVKSACQAAFTQITNSSGVDSSGTAAELFVKIGKSKYSVGTSEGELLGMDLVNGTGIVWRYNKDAGLVEIPVPQRVYADVLAMEYASSALALDANSTEAVTLHLSSNLRRENRLGDDTDASYQLPNPASFYILVAGAPQQKSVLALALTDGDSALALDAIEAMANTTGNKVLLGNDDARAPVLDALYFADRRVRYTAAITLASASPSEQFPGHVSVVPVLGQAVRQSDKLNALVVASGIANELTNAMENVGYKAVGDVDLGQAATKAVAAMPGVDLIVYSGDFNGFEAMYAAAKADGTLGVAPILALVDEGVASAITINYPGVQTAAALTSYTSDEEADRLERLSTQTLSTYGGEPISDEEALTYAEAALYLLRNIAGQESIYNAEDVLPVLIEALNDDRESVAVGAAWVLELLDNKVAQQGLADAALGRVGSVQNALLNSLAESAKAHGNQIERGSVDKLIELVNSSADETALSAARALGALTERPTSDTSGFILGK